MADNKVFFDTNALLYLLSEDESKANTAEALLAKGGVISVQVLNEFTSVAFRKLKMSYSEIGEVLETVRMVCEVTDLTVETHLMALSIAERYRFSFYDALILSAAILADCDVLYSEDMQSGQKINDQVVVHNPFQ
ncbi:MAG: PIN domain-containing protein [Thiolinea sp.]